MCLCSTGFQEADTRGELVQAIDRALDPCPDGGCTSIRLAKWIHQFALRSPSRRDLRGDDRRKLLIYEWHLGARRSVPYAVEQLWSPAGEVGVACFCTARPGHDDGRVHTLRIQDPAGSPTETSPPGVGDEEFWRAVDWARDFVSSWIGQGAAAERVRKAVVQVDPPHLAIRGSSVALSAIVAFTSLALRRPVRPEHVFSGVPGRSHDDCLPPESSTLLTKARVVRQREASARLVCPPHSLDGVRMGEQGSVVLEKTWQKAVCDALDLPSFDALMAEVVPRTSGALLTSNPFEERLREIVWDCLHAAGTEGVTRYELELCFDELRSQETRLQGVAYSAIGQELAQLSKFGHALQHDGRWRLQTEREPSPLGLERARRALASVSLQRGQLERALVLWARLHDTAELGRQLEAALSPSSSPESTHGLTLAAGLVHRVTHEHELRPPLVQTLRQLPTSVVRDQLLVALQCAVLPGPFASLAQLWGQCAKPLDRLFWLQSVTELTLVTLVALHPPTDEANPSTDWKNHLRRPSLGTLAKLVQQGVPDAFEIFSSQEQAEAFARPWNKLLHHRGAWGQVEAVLTEKALEERAAKVLSLLTLIPERGQELLAKLDPSQFLLLDGALWLFRRGEVDGHERFWAYDRMARAHRPLGSSSPPHLVAPLSSPRPAQGKERNLPLDRLPTPLAGALMALRQAQRATPPQLAAIDEATHWLLELAMPDAITQKEALKASGWGQLKTKRSLLETILHVPGSYPAPWAGRYLQGSSCRQLGYRLIALLERLEHGVPPLADWQPWLDEASSLLADWVEQSPWVEHGSSLSLWGRATSADSHVRFEALHPKLRPVVVAPPDHPVWILHDGRHAQPMDRLGVRPDGKSWVLTLEK